MDGDTSTNDTVLALSSCTAQLPKITDANSDAGQLLQGALDAIMQVTIQMKSFFFVWILILRLVLKLSLTQCNLKWEGSLAGLISKPR